MLLPIELNKTAKLTGMSLTSAFRNAARWGYRVGRVVKCGQMTMEAQQSEVSPKSRLVLLLVLTFL